MWKSYVLDKTSSRIDTNTIIFLIIFSSGEFTNFMFIYINDCLIPW